jgi:hypothetical protein
LGYLLFLIIALVPIIIYGVIVMLEIPGLADERLGKLEDLPGNLNEWAIDRDSPEGHAALAAGLQRETRLWQDPAGGFLGREKLLLQTRYRDAKTDEIIRTDPDRRFRRKRKRV